MMNRKGFTLIELLIVVVILGLLAAIAIPKFESTKEKAFLATMKGDLRNLVASQESYNADALTYYNGPLPSVAMTYAPSVNVSIVLSNVSATGWGAIATHPSTSYKCAVYVGSGGPLGAATVEGQVACAP